MPRFDDEDLTGAEFRECDLSRARMIGVVMQDAEIDGLVTNLVVNGIEVMPYVEAELDRRHPVRLLIRSDQPDDLREAWRQLRDDWATTTERVRSMPENSEHHGVHGEWSMVETLRHLVFVHDSWFRRCVLGVTEQFTAIGLGPPFVMDQEGGGLDSSARPSLDQVLAVRSRMASELEAWLAQVTPDQLAQAAPVPDDDRWPPYARGRTVRQCLGTVLNEEWAHHGFCRRDLDELSRQDSSQAAVVDEAKVITLCGSTTFEAEFAEVSQRLTMDGCVVISLGMFSLPALPDYDWTIDRTDLKGRLGGLHLQKIRMADEVYIVDPGGYVGESTRREIAYAESLGKPVRYLSRERLAPTGDGPQE